MPWLRDLPADPWFPSTKTCSRCGYVVEVLGLGERVFMCPECGYTADRDYNAAVNLAKLASESGESLNAGGGRIGVAVRSRPVKPEPKCAPHAREGSSLVHPDIYTT